MLNRYLYPFIILIIFIPLGGCIGDEPDSGGKKRPEYPVHEDIAVTIFWIGEEGSVDNGYIPNIKSSWDDKWQAHYGGVDDPADRNEYKPGGFTPSENPFYVALPYNDFDWDGNQKVDVDELIYWWDEQDWGERESLCKNRWLMISKGEISAYAQWEDVGPFFEDDSEYVFGSARPKDESDGVAGLDVSPAVRDYLGLKEWDIVNWQFVDGGEVPEGPWKETITTSQVYWD